MKRIDENKKNKSKSVNLEDNNQFCLGRAASKISFPSAFKTRPLRADNDQRTTHTMNTKKISSHPPKLSPLCILTSLSILFTALAPILCATDFPVTTVAQLRSAITSAGEGDTIILPVKGTFLMDSIDDDGGAYMGPAATRVIDKTLYIEANGTLLLKGGSAKFRAFNVGPGGHLIIRNAHIKGFSVKGGNGADGGGGGLGAGGAIYVKGGTLTVEACTFENNSAFGGNGSLGSSGGGGGMGGNGGHSGGNFAHYGGGGGGGARGNGGQGQDGADPGEGSYGAGGGGGGTVFDGGLGFIYEGGSLHGGEGGNQGHIPGGEDGQDGGDGGGGGGGESKCLCPAGPLSGNGGDGGYGGGGGGGGYITGDGGSSDFGGGGGAGAFSSGFFHDSGDGGDGGFGGGGGGDSGGELTHQGSAGLFGGDGNVGAGGGGAGLGGAIFNHGGHVEIYNSTFTGNLAQFGAYGGGDAHDGRARGGAIFSVDGNLKIYNSTISGNTLETTDPRGGGIYSLRDTVNIYNTIIAYNSPIEAVIHDPSASNGDGNLVLNNSNDGVNGVDETADPLLYPLNPNPPGLTMTMAIDANSPAYNGGSATGCQTYDQRGVERAPHAPCDIGAYEAGNNPPVALCKDVTVSADANCVANASIDNGSFDFDAGDSVVSITQDPPGPYSLGPTPVQLAVTDSFGAVSYCSGNVTVVDDTPPAIGPCPNQTVSATSPAGAVATFPTPSATDNCAIPTVTCSPNSGSTFPIGTTTVTCTASDGSNQAQCAFTVKVKGAAEQIADLIVKVNDLPNIKTATKNALVVKLNAAATALKVNDTATACVRLQDFINLAKAQMAKKLVPPSVATDLIADATRIRAVLACP